MVTTLGEVVAAFRLHSLNDESCDCNKTRFKMNLLTMGSSLNISFSAGIKLADCVQIFNKYLFLYFHEIFYLKLIICPTAHFWSIAINSSQDSQKFLRGLIGTEHNFNQFFFKVIEARSFQD